MDNFGESTAGGGITDIALGVANDHARESGLRALHETSDWGHGGSNSHPGSYPADESPYPFHPAHDRGHLHPADSYGSQAPLAGGAAIASGANYSDRSLPMDQYPPQHSPEYSRPVTAFGAIDPNEIEDDGDDGFPAESDQKRKTLLGGFGKSSKSASRDALAVGGAGAAAGAGVGAGAGAAAASGAFSNFNSGDGSGNYGPVPGGNSTEYNHGIENEKSEWLAQEKSGNKKLKWIVGTILAVLVVAAIVGGVIGGILGSRNKDSSSSSSSPKDDDDDSNDLNKDSASIKALMNDSNLHRVFPGMDYTPWGAQYPDCHKWPPSQNNITKDIAILSQLTPAVRLYGTDCNQTEMVLHAIDRLEITDVKVWLGVWLGSNDTTNTRQISQLWDILDKHGDDPFAGVIVGNEVLYRKDLKAAELSKILGNVKSNLTDKNLDLPLATSDLGDNWTADLAREVDIIMANIHPFFAGVRAEQAASWTWTFWQGNDVPVTQGMTGKRHVISETGWPSGGGNDCGTGSDTDECKSGEGSVAGITEMNTFMEDWVCEALSNGTEYFWFETFDEPWKVVYNTDSQKWEDKWGLMDQARRLKKGVKIPDCGGATATLATGSRTTATAAAAR
ncbi:glycoside hydrolase family 17 protein [Aplosporella prunicola CBS 121167]|uniref:glucan endo-1,3-beta-D-glucosidase n=1 Tax=Aplosporella prunicola CBS 121167 TaxID=1176127 RepID=A0A6A6B8D3_9PEZI|nr:glycoside hydrolase family 17 protein [Aplosporella prunicola CBS 121167]KAF2139167.1 glycoside hydrolase family 17 protein [Aplosporella prunicola CBS 121167]